MNETIVTLKKGEGRAFKAGGLWIYDNEIESIHGTFKNGAVDEAAYREFIEFQISEGIHGLVPCGTTGESATLSHEEHERVIEICIDQVKGRVPVLAGAGSNNTIEAIRLTRFAQKAGADGALLLTPYYKVCTATSRPSPKLSTCLWSPTTFPAVPAPTCCLPPSAAWPMNSPISWA